MDQTNVPDTQYQPIALTQAADDPTLARPDDLAYAREQLAEQPIPVIANRSEDVEGRLERSSVKLSHRQAQAIDLLLAGLSMSAVAQRLGISRRTIHRWRYNHPQFIAVYARVNQELGEQTARRAERLICSALEITEQALSRNNKNPQRLSAAIRVLSAMRVARLTFASPGESCFNLALDEIIRKQRLEENLDPNLPITRYDREDALRLLESQNYTERADELCQPSSPSRERNQERVNATNTNNADLISPDPASQAAKEIPNPQ